MHFVTAVDLDIPGDHRSSIGIDDGKVRTLPGVNIYWEDSQQGTVSDGDGRFTLKQKSGQHMLVFSFVGYETRVVHVNGNGPLQVILEPNLEIGEVVVTEKDRGSYLSTIDPIHTERIGGAELHKAGAAAWPRVLKPTRRSM